jgi:hypothetical protein
VIPLKARGKEERYLLVLFEEALPAAEAARVDRTRPQTRDENWLTLLSVLLKGLLSKWFTAPPTA